MGLRIGEALSHNGAVPEGRKPLVWQSTQGGPHDLRVQVGGGALWPEDQQTAVLHAELEPLDTLGSAPTDPEVAILEGVTGWPPSQKGHGLGIDFDDLAEEISDGLGGTQIVVEFELLIEPGLFGLGLNNSGDRFSGS
jgi:hypothetical protein